jgi:hypothetical protein
MSPMCLFIFFLGFLYNYCLFKTAFENDAEAAYIILLLKETQSYLKQTWQNGIWMEGTTEFYHR